MVEVFWEISEGEMAEFFWKLTEKQAEAFFNEYMGLRGERLTAVKSQFREESGGPETDLDFTPDSLVELWRWVMKRIQLREYTSAEQDHIGSLPDWFRKHQLEHKPLSRQSLNLLNDVAYYFAEVFIRNHPGVEWMICKTKIKRHNDGNQPVLSGFSVSMNPRDLVTVAALKSLRGKATENELLRLYEIWTQNLSKPPSNESR